MTFSIDPVGNPVYKTVMQLFPGRTQYPIPSPVFNDSRDQLFPNMFDDGRMTRARAEELRLHRYIAIEPCAQCGGHEYKLSYPTRSLNGRTKQDCVQCAAQHKLDNRAHYTATDAERRARKQQATPRWLTDQHRAEIEAFYVEAARLTQETGVAHQVDHIIPITHKLVSGLHVPWNLQVITASENASKSNRFDCDQYVLDWPLHSGV